jgi:hypothetical protein
MPHRRSSGGSRSAPTSSARPPESSTTARTRARWSTRWPDALLTRCARMPWASSATAGPSAASAARSPSTAARRPGTGVTECSGRGERGPTRCRGCWLRPPGSRGSSTRSTGSTARAMRCAPT